MHAMETMAPAGLFFLQFFPNAYRWDTGGDGRRQVMATPCCVCSICLVGYVVKYMKVLISAL